VKPKVAEAARYTHTFDATPEYLAELRTRMNALHAQQQTAIAIDALTWIYCALCRWENAGLCREHNPLYVLLGANAYGDRYPEMFAEQFVGGERPAHEFSPKRVAAMSAFAEEILAADAAALKERVVKEYYSSADVLAVMGLLARATERFLQAIASERALKAVEDKPVLHQGVEAFFDASARLNRVPPDDDEVECWVSSADTFFECALRCPIRVVAGPDSTRQRVDRALALRQWTDRVEALRKTRFIVDRQLPAAPSGWRLRPEERAL